MSSGFILTTAHCGHTYQRVANVSGRTRKYCDACKPSSGPDSPAKLCTTGDCQRPLRAKGLCAMHWRRRARADGREISEQWNQRRKSNYHKRRAQKLMVPADSISPADVYERDGWLCGICGTQVDRTAVYPDPMSPSLDHVLPLSLGGHHTLENVALAHLSCNVRKGNRIEAGAMSV